MTSPEDRFRGMVEPRDGCMFQCLCDHKRAFQLAKIEKGDVRLKFGLDAVMQCCAR